MELEHITQALVLLQEISSQPYRLLLIEFS